MVLLPHPFLLELRTRQEALLAAARLDLVGGPAHVLDLAEIRLRTVDGADAWVVAGYAEARALHLVEAERADAGERAEQLRRLREASLTRRVDFSPGWREQGVAVLEHAFPRLGAAAGLSLFVSLDWPDADQELLPEADDDTWTLRVMVPAAVRTGYLARWRMGAWLLPNLVSLGTLVEVRPANHAHP